MEPNQITEDRLVSDQTLNETDFLNMLETGEAPPVNTDPIKKENSFSFNDEPPAEGPTTNDQRQTNNINASELVSGELAAELLDKIGAVIAVYGARYFLEIEVNKSAFKLNASEKNTLAPILEKCMQGLNISLENPYYALLISLSFIYGSKALEVANNPDLAKPIKKAAEKVKKVANVVNRPPANDEIQVKFATPNYTGTRKAGETRGRKPKYA
jgi:hypothetical protein